MATVVPAEKLLLWITWSPSLTGISRIVPDTVALIFVFAVVDPETEPFLIISKSFWAADKFSFAWLYDNSALSKSCCEIICFAYKSVDLWKSLSAFLTASLKLFTWLWTL